MQYRYLSKWLESVVAIMRGKVKCAVNLIIPLIWFRVSNQSRYQIFPWNTLSFQIILWNRKERIFTCIFTYMYSVIFAYFLSLILIIIFYVYQKHYWIHYYILSSSSDTMSSEKLKMIWKVYILHLYKLFYNKIS